MNKARICQAAARTTPLLGALAVFALARIPGARSWLPALALFTGPLGGALIVGALALVLARLRPRPARLQPRPWLLFLVGAALSATVAVRHVRAVEPSGDEIDYLMMAQSVWREGDLDLRDNFARGDHLEYLSGLPRMPGGVRDREGRHRPTHSGGLAVLMAPFYALGGRVGCALALAFFAAGLGLLVRDLALRATGNERAAIAAWAAATGPPVLFYTAFLYGEVVVAFCIALAMWAGVRLPGAWGGLLPALALAALPWLHVRMTLTAAAVGAVTLACLRGRARAVFLLTAGLMAAAYAGYQLRAFGTLSPLARYGGELPPAMQGRTPLRTLVGLFVDGAYGLLPYAPVFLLSFAGLPALLAGRIGPDARAPKAESPGAARPGLRWLALAVAVGVLAPVLAWRNWWGASPPARFTIPLVPVLALLLAARIAAHPERGLARWRWPLIASSFALALFLFADPWQMLAVNGRDGTAHGFDALAGEASFSRYLPFLSSRLGSTAPPWEPPAAEGRVAGVWLAALALLLLLDRLALVRDRVNRWFYSPLLPLLLLAGVSLAVEHWARR